MRQRIVILVVALAVLCLGRPAEAVKKKKDPKIVAAVSRALDYLAREQRRQGYWEANQSQYRVAMTALAGNAMLAEGSTTTRGKYSKNIRLAVDYLLDMAQPSGLIGFKDDYHYTYGHGFSMLFLSQVFGEEEDAERRADLKRVLIKAVEFSAQAQTERGGWGYVSAKDQPNFDEGSTCITQVQGLRACRNAGIPVPKEIIEKAKKYIQDCTTPEGACSTAFVVEVLGRRSPLRLRGDVQRRRVRRIGTRQEDAGVLQAKRLAGQGRQQPALWTLALRPLLLRAGCLPAWRRGVEQVLRGHQQRDPQQAVGKWSLEGRPRRRGLQHRDEHHDLATRQRLPADLPALRRIHRPRRYSFFKSSAAFDSNSACHSGARMQSLSS